jgi:hypothetical protein
MSPEETGRITEPEFWIEDSRLQVSHAAFPNSAI